MPIFKDPATDSGLKKSARGLLRVDAIAGRLLVTENVDWEQEAGGLLQVIFEDGKALNLQSLAEIRERIESQL